MSPSGAEFIKRIKEQITEVDPSDVSRSLGNGVAVIDVREAEEYARAHLPGAKHVPRGYLESRIDGAVPDRKQRVILYCASGNRSALAAHDADRGPRLRARRVDDRRHHALEGPRLRRRGPAHAHRRAARPLQPPPARCPRSAPRASRSCSTPRSCCSAPAASARRPRSTSQPPASARSGSSTTTSSTSPTSSARSSTRPSRVGVPKVDSAEQAIKDAQPRRQASSSTRRAWTPRTSWRSSRATTSSSTASTTSRRATCSTTRPCA